MRKYDIKTPKWLHLTEKDEVELGDEKFTYPVVVKPNSEGSTVGVTIVKNEYDLDEANKKLYDEIEEEEESKLEIGSYSDIVDILIDRVEKEKKKKSKKK